MPVVSTDENKCRISVRANYTTLYSKVVADLPRIHDAIFDSSILHIKLLLNKQLLYFGVCEFWFIKQNTAVLEL